MCVCTPILDLYQVDGPLFRKTAYALLNLSYVLNPVVVFNFYVSALTYFRKLSFYLHFSTVDSSLFLGVTFTTNTRAHFSMIESLEDMQLSPCWNNNATKHTSKSSLSKYSYLTQGSQMSPVVMMLPRMMCSKASTSQKITYVALVASLTMVEVLFQTVNLINWIPTMSLQRFTLKSLNGLK